MTRVLVSTSENDFRYRNYDSKQFVINDNGEIVDACYPLQRNRNGAFRDLHLLQEFYYTSRQGDRLSFAAWYLDTDRGLALLSSDRNSTREKRNSQTERTLRVATKYPAIARRFYAAQSREIEIIKLNGSIELAPLLGLSDVIVDIVETGTTLRQNNLEVTREILPVSARFIANKAAMKFKEPAISGLLSSIQAQLNQKEERP